MDLQQRLAQRREQQRTDGGSLMIGRQERPNAEVRYPGQKFDNQTLAQERLHEQQFNGFRQANGRFPQGDELDKWVSEQAKNEKQEAPRVADATFDKALSVNMDRQENGKRHIDMPVLMDALDRASKQRQDQTTIEKRPELKGGIPRISR